MRSIYRKNMLKVVALIIGGIFLMAFGIYFLSVADLSVLAIQLPAIDVNWAVVAFVMIVGSVVTLGSAFVVSKLT